MLLQCRASSEYGYKLWHQLAKLYTGRQIYYIKSGDLHYYTYTVRVPSIV